jgi:hypothetical protein
MKWIKRGIIFDTSSHGLELDCNDYAQSPQTLIFDNFVRIYFSTRQRDITGQYLSKIAFIDFDKEFKRVINFSREDVIALGDLGTFDEHGIFPFNPMRVDNKIIAYTCGWSRRISVPVETSTGLAISTDHGLTFIKYGSGPIFTSTISEPFLVGDSFVIYENQEYHMWYMYGWKWFLDPIANLPERVYKIAYASSNDGIQWLRDSSRNMIENVIGDNECQALPTVIKIGDCYHMYFCYRHATDFRKNSDRAYKLGYAYSFDKRIWIRDDKNKGINLSASGWDSQMMCYPHIFELDRKIYLLYNGNEFGKFGFGLAELSDV